MRRTGGDRLCPARYDPWLGNSGQPARVALTAHPASEKSSGTLWVTPSHDCVSACVGHSTTAAAPLTRTDGRRHFLHRSGFSTRSRPTTACTLLCRPAGSAAWTLIAGLQARVALPRRRRRFRVTCQIVHQATTIWSFSAPLTLASHRVAVQNPRRFHASNASRAETSSA